MAQTHAKRRLTKHQLKEDAFTTAIFSAREWVDQNLRLVLLAVGGAVAVIAIVWGITAYVQNRQAAAAALFGQAGVELRANNLSAAIITLQQLVDDYGGSSVAGLACFQLADAHYRQRNFDDARVAYQRYLDAYGNDDMLVASAWAGLAAIDEHNNDFKAGAEKNIRAASFDLGSFLAPEYLNHAIRCAISADDSSMALEAFNLLMENTENTRAVNLARQTLVEHGLLAPTTR
jgi:predicted negative regulator of RcsB-dependent stress response